MRLRYRSVDQTGGDNASEVAVRDCAAGRVSLPTIFCLQSRRIRSAAFSAIIIAGTLVLPDTSVGMIEQSATQRRSAPRTRKYGSTTASSSDPMRQVPAG